MPNGVQSEGAARRAAERARVWAFIMYPESVPENWRSVLSDSHIPAAAILHDRDVTADGELKKPHYHVMLFYRSVKSYAQVRALTDSLNATSPEQVGDTRGYVRYLCHADDPDKAQYSISEIIRFGGVDLRKWLKPTIEERYDLISEMIAFCNDNNVTEFAELMTYASLERHDDWFPLLCDNSAYVMRSHIASLRHSQLETSDAPTD